MACITKPTELNHAGACGGYAKANGKIVQSCAQFTSLLAGNKRACKTEMANALNHEGIKLPSSSIYRNREFAGEEDPEAYKASFQYLDGYSDSFSETTFVNVLAACVEIVLSCSMLQRVLQRVLK